MSSARAFAPATVANVGPGFDILGFAVGSYGDEVEVSCVPDSGVRIKVAGPGAEVIPTAPELNTATAGILRLAKDVGYTGGFEVAIDKGIPIGSGLGGSAASAVAGVVAAYAALGLEGSLEEKLSYALVGEAVASGDAHPDNAAPCLFGGFTFAKVMGRGEGGQVRAQDLQVLAVPAPDLDVVLVHPEVRIDTRAAREVLPVAFDRAHVVAQTGNLARMLASAYRGDSMAFARACVDVLVEPYRKALIPDFDAVRDAAMAAGALGFSISGSGPTMFALVPKGQGAAVAVACEQVYAGRLPAFSFVSEFGAAGARVLP